MPKLNLTRRQLGTLTAVAASGVALGLPETAVAQSGYRPDLAAKHQFRALWIATVSNIDWPSAAGLSAQQQRTELISWLDLAVRLRLNAVFLHVRPTADAFWPSRYEPWSQYLTGKQGVNPGYDPLAFAVAEAHKRNLELHAWFNPYHLSKQTHLGQLASEHPARQHPDWVFAYGPELYYNPGIPEVRRFVENAILDALSGHDVDGVHFDDYFYPYPIAGQVVPDVDTFAKYGAEFDSVQDWRRDNINKLVVEIGQRVRRAKPWVKFGISPFGIWRNRATDPRGSDTKGLQSYDEIYADTRLWVESGWVDYIVPQLYWNIGWPLADYAKLVPWWSEQVRGTDVQLYLGEAAYRVGERGAWSNPAELSSHLTLNRNYPEVTGNVYFSAKSLRADTLGATSQLVAEHYRHPAITPPMDHLWHNRPRVQAPMLVRARRTGGGVELRWESGGVHLPTSYAVYRFDGQARVQDCDFADATHLLATIRNQWFTDATAAAGRSYTYHVTALDRLSAESEPTSCEVT
ncbi:MAG: glycosyl hydrolase [Acidimicrobiales bacterium]|nr:MAG: glycosyl hydrolase [Acidimicrobiales bacterium]